MRSTEVNMEFEIFFIYNVIIVIYYIVVNSLAMLVCK